ncbi:HI1506-related protein [Neptunomonas japonica]|uniref:HI1506-related protein n=1 Tax=Neptunomonas japonica TaxID=417574 RepID=UPI0003FA5578|nr:HI1506-related protein [Neptunomonas japonica]
MPKNTHATHIRITAAVEGFRRAGIAHSTEPTIYAVDDFSEEQLEQLHKEPRLVVEFVEAPEADQADNEEGAVGPDGVGAALKDMTVPQLKEIAAAGEIVGFASMNKAALIQAIEDARAAQIAQAEA